ncbi:MAG: hypothetical protein NVSMB56_02910 [Pyrinomonadaceae bacterium]
MQLDPKISDELARRHRTAVSVVAAMFLAALSFVALSFVIAPRISATSGKSSIETVLRVLVVLIGIIAVGLRRISFAPRRLQDITTLKGTSALITTLQRTTIIVATLGSDIALIGFMITLLSGEPGNALMFGVAAVAVLLYAYPRRAAWQRIVESMQNENELTVSQSETAKGTIA